MRGVVSGGFLLLIGWCAACTGHVEEPTGDTALVPGAQPAAADSGKPASNNSNGAAGKSGSSAAPGGGSTPEVETAAATSAYPRLSHRQWAVAAQDLLLLDSTPDVSGFANDAPAATGFDNSGDTLEVSQGLWGDYQSASEAVAAKVAGDSKLLAKITPPGLPASGDARAQAFVGSLGERAFRRPLTSAESTAFVALFKQGPSLFPGRGELSAGAELTIQALLQAPGFVYRQEQGGTPDKNGVAALSDYEIAARLSFMLWDSLPDQTLLAAAKAGKLHEPAQIAEQARRMLESPRAADKLVEFHRQLLELRRYDSLHPEGLPDAIGAALRGETERFVRAVLVDDKGSYSDLLTASYSFVNRDIAGLYGLSGSYGTDLVRAELDPEQRAGLLTQPGFLMYRSGDTAPILRGVFINMKFLCADLPPPPVFTPPKVSGTTRRERVNSITGMGTCGEGCHARVINPAGYPLEYFDNQGRYRSQDGGKPVDGSAAYSFSDGMQSYDGPVEWARVLSESRQSHECYVRHWLEFGFGRSYAASDAPLVQRVAQASLNDSSSVRELLTLLVQSPSFKARKLEAQ